MLKPNTKEMKQTLFHPVSRGMLLQMGERGRHQPGLHWPRADPELGEAQLTETHTTHTHCQSLHTVVGLGGLDELEGCCLSALSSLLLQGNDWWSWGEDTMDNRAQFIKSFLLTDLYLHERERVCPEHPSPYPLLTH